MGLFKESDIHSLVTFSPLAFDVCVGPMYLPGEDRLRSRLVDKIILNGLLVTAGGPRRFAGSLRYEVHTQGYTWSTESEVRLTVAPYGGRHGQINIIWRRRAVADPFILCLPYIHTMEVAPPFLFCNCRAATDPKPIWLYVYILPPRHINFNQLQAPGLPHISVNAVTIHRSCNKRVPLYIHPPRQACHSLLSAPILRQRSPPLLRISVPPLPPDFPRTGRSHPLRPQHYLPLARPLLHRCSRWRAAHHGRQPMPGPPPRPRAAKRESITHTQDRQAERLGAPGHNPMTI